MKPSSSKKVIDNLCSWCMQKKKILFASAVLLVALSGIYILYIVPAPQEVYAKKCSNLDQVAKMQCWVDSFESAVQHGSVDAAVLEAIELFKGDPTFAADCHSFMHLIGASAYDLHKTGGEFSVSPELNFCTYGFYHGFMEASVQETGEYLESRKFCRFVNSKLNEYGVGVSFECFHGIGHGIVDNHTAAASTTPEEVTAEALGVCSEVAETEVETQNCAAGVFHMVAELYTSDNRFGWEIDSEDPLALCKGEYSYEVKNACNGLHARLIDELYGNNDFKKALLVALKVGEPDYMQTIIINIATYYRLSAARRIAEEGNNRVDEEVLHCRDLTEPYDASCLKGWVGGILQSAIPGAEYDEASIFCNLSILNNTERDICFEEVMTYLPTIYMPEKMSTICKEVDPEYRSYCSK